MVQVLKNNKGFTLSEILVATIILSIAALAFVATIQSTTKMGKQATTNDAAYSIARQRLALMQDGELLVRQNYVDSTERDNIMYHTLDEVVYGTADLPAKLTITVSWKTPREKSISLTGYLNRDICPEEVNDLTEVDLTISNVTIPEDAPSNTEVGELTVIDPNNINLHMFLYDDATSDNALFKVEKGRLYTSSALTKGEKKVVLIVEDCAGTQKEFTLLIDVTAKDEVPNIEDQEFSVNEDELTGFQIGKVYATPLNVVYTIISQEPVPALSIGNDGMLVVGSATSLDYEANPVLTLKVEAWNDVNDEYKDTATITVKVLNVNEAPHEFLYTGLDVIDDTMSAGRQLGKFSVNDTDAGDNSHKITFTGTNAFSYLLMNNFVTPQTLHIGAGVLKDYIGTHEVVFTATDAGGLTIEKKMLFTIVDTDQSGGCGSYHEYIKGHTYNNGDQAYLTNYIYQAKWWTQSVPTVSNNDWEYIGACDGDAACADFTDFANGRDYNAGNIVTHANGVYKATTYSKNVTPTENSTKWKKVSTCSN